MKTSVIEMRDMLSVLTVFFKEGGQFFEAAAVLLVFILLGHWLEMRARAGLKSLVCRRRLVDASSDRLEVFDVENPWVKIPVPTDHIEGVVIQDVF